MRSIKRPNHHSIKPSARRSRVLLLGALSLVHHTVAEDPHVGILIAPDRLAAAHATRKQGVDRAGYLVDGGIVMARGDVHDFTIARPDPRRQSSTDRPAFFPLAIGEPGR